MLLTKITMEKIGQNTYWPIQSKYLKQPLKKGDTLHHFALNVTQTQFADEKKPYIIVTLTDISQEIKQQEELKQLNENLGLLIDEKTKELKHLNENLEQRVKEEIKKNQHKDKILFQQSKMASMGEMLANIAHQWRQPLSSISVAASGIKLKQEMKTLDEEFIEESCEHILNNTQYLSQTIDDFKNFFKYDKQTTLFYLHESLYQCEKLIHEKLKKYDVQLHIEINKNIELEGFRNEFQQAILNILYNSIDALIQTQNNTERFIFIKYDNDKLYIKDNAKGVEDSILNKIFEPYFTTKHQSQGTGIGLYMTQEILQKHMRCQLEASNHTFNFQNKNYKGLQFIIAFEK